MLGTCRRDTSCWLGCLNKKLLLQGGKIVKINSDKVQGGINKKIQGKRKGRWGRGRGRRGRPGRGQRWAGKQDAGERWRQQRAGAWRGRQLQAEDRVLPWCEVQITDSGSAASSSSHGGRKQNGVKRAKLDRTFKILINSAQHASWSTSKAQNTSLATSQFKDVQKNQENPHQDTPNYPDYFH